MFPFQVHCVSLQSETKHFQNRIRFRKCIVSKRQAKPAWQVWHQVNYWGALWKLENKDILQGQRLFEYSIKPHTRLKQLKRSQVIDWAHSAQVFLQLHTFRLSSGSAFLVGSSIFSLSWFLPNALRITIREISHNEVLLKAHTFVHCTGFSYLSLAKRQWWGGIPFCVPAEKCYVWTRFFLAKAISGVNMPIAFLCLAS